MKAEQVEEVQGLYGPFTLSERVIQKIWLRQDFATEGLTSSCGLSIEVEEPGRWNLLGGPDFKEARLRIDGLERAGDVEIHFNKGDWFDHQHQLNPAFNRVVLHVYLYPESEDGRPVQTLSGQEPVSMILLPLLDRDLEDYAIDDALRELEGVDELAWVADFIALPFEARLDRIEALAAQRWERKVHFAQKHFNQLAWEGACHLLCLEVLGYARNRVPMTRIAMQYDLDVFRKGAYRPLDFYESQRGRWRLDGLRPANHPKRRLEQYWQLVHAQSDWPLRLKEALEGLNEAESTVGTKSFRRRNAVPQFVEALRGDIFAGLVGETRFHTMMVDAFLPLATAAGLIDGFAYWSHWYPGDVPDTIRRLLKHATLVSPQRPSSNGLIQGALGLSLQRGR
ncbi:MAG: DUF2851 family protein [Verrucomicrobiota bacterium]